ncbi:hypothetical protein PGT21_022784 [Puccinia graminis f. sp. tritici]|uniref:Uncharacterized protein n=1 Tax=Puccinia graminis f. sp. tritici TaxID=56615 RepID=A0A5B0Q6L0_PUCGR|nr:hypothetical protein PGT21_022784 [Puccinia graminis f. sp. tritici]
MSRTSNLEFVRDPNLTLQDPPGTPQAPQEVVFWRFSSDRPSERRRLTRIRPLNAQRPPRTPPSPSTTPDRRRTTRIDSDRRRTTQGDPPRPRPLPKAPEALRSTPEAPAAQRSAPGRPSAPQGPQTTCQSALEPSKGPPERPTAPPQPPEPQDRGSGGLLNPQNHL